MTVSQTGSERIEFIADSLCLKFSLDRTLVILLLNEVESLYHSLGIIRVHEKPTTEQLAIGMKCLINQESPSIIYTQMIHSGDISFD